jgi:Cu2+-exporting ATPase
MAPLADKNSSAEQNCYHCGLPVPAASYFPVAIHGKEQLMCCPGCQAVATAIVEGGLDSFYQFRTATNERPNSTSSHWEIYDLAEVQAEFVLPVEGNWKQANVLLEGISCAACSWLIETHLKKNPVVRSVIVNLTTHRCSIVWDSSQPLSVIFQSLAGIGYIPRPATEQENCYLSYNCCLR